MPQTQPTFVTILTKRRGLPRSVRLCVCVRARVFMCVHECLRACMCVRGRCHHGLHHRPLSTQGSGEDETTPCMLTSSGSLLQRGL